MTEADQETRACILRHRELDPRADTAEIALRVSIALGCKVEEAFVDRVLAAEREQQRSGQVDAH